MKTSFLKILYKLFIFTLFFISCNLDNPSKSEKNIDPNKMTIADDSILSDSLKICYKNDASRLVLRNFQNNSSLLITMIELPEEDIEDYYNGIIHIYNQYNLPARDSVFDMYEIHTFPNPEMNSFIVAVDSNANWTQAWRNGNPLTGNSQIDSLITQYNIQVSKYYYWPFGHATVLQTSDNVNLLALCPLFSNIDGIYYAEPNGWGGDGNDIQTITIDEFIIYKFSIGWGDCPAGCIHHHFWEFKVIYNGTVEYIGSNGDPIPL